MKSVNLFAFLLILFSFTGKAAALDNLCELDLEKFAKDETGIIDISSNWCFFKDQHLTLKEIRQSLSKTVKPISLPFYWNKLNKTC